MSRYHSRAGRSRGIGFTLVEMMIALVITLMIVFAMVEAFRWVGETTTDGRAVIEMLGQMRHARFRLEDDLSRCTVPLEPWRIEGGQYQGSFELLEGFGSDVVPPGVAGTVTGNYLVRVYPTTPPAPPVPQAGLMFGRFDFNDAANTAAAQSQSMLGDLDDIVYCTVRNDDKPFRGRYGGNVIESNYAEIIWWAELNDRVEDLNGDGVIDPPEDRDYDGILTFGTGGPDQEGEGGYGTWNPGETFTIRRRVLLIRPDLNDAQGLVQALNAGTLNTNNALNNYDNLMRAVRDFQALNDISVRVHFNAGDPTLAPPVPPQAVGIAANSLGDLTYRHNRVAHAPLSNSLLDGAGRLSGLSLQPLPPPTPAGTRPPPPAPNPPEPQPAMSAVDPRYLPAILIPDLYGEDVVLNNVLAFDFRVWDPNVPVVAYVDPMSPPAANPALQADEGLLPSDPGYAAALVSNPTVYDAVSNPNGRVRGRGGYVDLGGLTAFGGAGGALDLATNRQPPFPAAAVFHYNAQFVRNMRPRSFLLTAGGLPAALANRPIKGYFVYDPWTVVYEKDGYNQDVLFGGPIVPRLFEDPTYALDEGSNGIDDNGFGGPDDLVQRASNQLDDDTDMLTDEADEDRLSETETYPPYPHALTSLRVHLRMYEPDTRQVRQVSQTVRFGIE